MSVEGSTPQQPASAAAAVDLVAVYRQLIRMKRALDEKKRLTPTDHDTAPEARTPNAAEDDPGGTRVSG